MKIPLLLPLLVASATSWAQVPKDAPLVTNGAVTVTAEDFEAFLLRAPEKHRPEIRASYERIGKAVDLVYTNRILAEEAKRQGLDKDPLIELRRKQLDEAYLAQLWVEKYRETAQVPDLTARAEEIYRLNKDKFRDPERAEARHVLVTLRGRTREDALARATEVYRKAIAGEDFIELVKQYSEDPRALRDYGRLRVATAAELEKPFADALFALKKPGDIVGPIETRAGFHIIRLEKRFPGGQRPFEAVKGGIIEEERNRLVGEAADRRIDELKNNQNRKVYENNINALHKDMTPAELEAAQMESLLRGPAK